MGPSATFLDYYVKLDAEDEWDLADLNAVGELPQHTVLRTKPTKLEEACRRAYATALSFMMDVAGSAFWCVVCVVGVKPFTLCAFVVGRLIFVFDDYSLRLMAF